MEKYKKILRKLPKALRLRVIKALYKIGDNDLKGLDVVLLSGKHEFYRCRVGKIRILFQKQPSGNVVMDIGFRGDVYK
ncbi:plasmid stabilization system [Candidatus Peregrinibacteria bacterium]|jgi:mRNA-degrading endonuclease RelE of RelBE toxin-antitoxin system|nr:plasmid stabilization system [Candidatus Peregrinibacteria bacterium]MBT4056048.1 plasmid stabilization system [Candidatus Peregrinibacteria bacterium]